MRWPTTQAYDVRPRMGTPNPRIRAAIQGMAAAATVAVGVGDGLDLQPVWPGAGRGRKPGASRGRKPLAATGVG